MLLNYKCISKNNLITKKNRFELFSAHVTVSFSYDLLHVVWMDDERGTQKATRFKRQANGFDPKKV